MPSRRSIRGTLLRPSAGCSSPRRRPRPSQLRPCVPISHCSRRAGGSIAPWRLPTQQPWRPCRGPAEWSPPPRRAPSQPPAGAAAASTRTRRRRLKYSSQGQASYARPRPPRPQPFTRRARSRAFTSPCNSHHLLDPSATPLPRRARRALAACSSELACVGSRCDHAVSRPSVSSLPGRGQLTRATPLCHSVSDEERISPIS